MVSDPAKKSTKSRKTGHGRKSEKSIILVDINSIRPCPENDDIYAKIDPDSPEIQRLAEDINRRGILEPLRVSADGVIISGHRRYNGARKAGLSQVPVVYDEIRYEDNIDAFLELLVACNMDQREKTFEEKVREEATRHNPYQAHLTLLKERNKPREIAESFKIEGVKSRSRISPAKQQMVDTLIQVLEENVKPMTVRQIFYQFLSKRYPILKHLNKPDSIFSNSNPDYKNLVDLVARARTQGIVSMWDIADETRGSMEWNAHDNTRTFIWRENREFLCGYFRDLQQSQPHHIEILAEKNTIYSTVNQIAQEYCVPTTSGRGYCSLPARHAVVQRYLKSGKDKLVILIVSDFDPDGEEIAQSFARSLRDDFNIENVHPIKVALKYEHIEQFDLVPNMEAKKTSSRYKKFYERYGTNDVFEVEALRPKQLQDLLKAALDSVMDLDLFNREIEQEKHDAVEIEAYRQAVLKYIGNYRKEESN
ncbi:ParB-like nuclease domain protein [Gimesia maris]|uniref:ParB N-terminal domain-containing protein n=1 Tax=Gimesia maris TaxID=122 RepID=UPI00118B2C7D|nr:ParB N-terminal domain-containing protein [Gimesia maris]QDT77933.1 ParB-like nuclease domain protein [Gimesia maris]